MVIFNENRGGFFSCNENPNNSIIFVLGFLNGLARKKIEVIPEISKFCAQKGRCSQQEYMVRFNGIYCFLQYLLVVFY